MRPRAVVPVLLAAGGLAWILARGLDDDLVYYTTPGRLTEAVRAGEPVRLGGQVRPGSVHRAGDRLRFVLQDARAGVPVVFAGSVPATFRSGQGAIVEGRYGPGGVMRADTLVVRHGNRYVPEGG